MQSEPEQGRGFDVMIDAWWVCVCMERNEEDRLIYDVTT